MEYLALWENFCDGYREGDAERVIRCWKFLFPYLFQDAGHSKKYLIETFYIMLQLNCLLREQDAHSLMWNRFSKSKAGSGIFIINLQYLCTILDLKKILI